MKQLDQYLATVDEIEQITGNVILVADSAKYNKPSESRAIQKGCNEAVNYSSNAGRERN